MTVREAAEELGIPEQTLRNNIISLFPEIMQNGIATYLNEAQVTALKLEIERHHNLSSTGQVVRVSTRDVAEALGCKIKTVFNNAKICLPNKRIENGKQTLWTENEVTVLLAYMKCNNNNQHDLVRSLQGIETSQSLELEAALAAQKAIELQQRVIDKLRKDNAEKAERLSIAEPKAETLDKITATSSDISVRELAAVLAVPHLGQNKLFQRLRDDGYIDRFNRPYRQYIEGGFMYEKEYYVPQLDATKQQLRITQKGVAHFAKKYSGIPA